MKVLIVGAGKGSWEMRGLQVGAALGARVTSQPTDRDWQWADIAILVKKQAVIWAPHAQRHSVPIVWDVLDCWSQPRDNKWSIEEGRRHVAMLGHVIRPAAMIAATRQMAEDIGGVYIPHQCRIGLAPRPMRPEVETVAYDGSERYLGAWEPALRVECQRRGWRFVCNPPDLSEADLLVAFRDGWWDGPLCRAWKSGVKIVNAMTCGRPIVSQACSAIEELRSVGCTIETVSQLAWGLDIAARPDMRRLAVAGSRDAFSVQNITQAYYVPLLERVLAEQPCTAA